MTSQREKQSDAEILKNLFIQYRDKMYGIAFAILHNQHQAEDAVSDAFEHFFPYLGKCRDTSGYQTKVLLTRFVKNAAIDIYRKNKRESGNISVDEQQWMGDAYQPMEAYMKALEFEELIRQIKETLPEHYWHVVRMKYFEGMPVREIAMRLNLSEENIYSRLRRAKGKIKKMIGDERNE